MSSNDQRREEKKKKKQPCCWVLDEEFDDFKLFPAASKKGSSSGAVFDERLLYESDYCSDEGKPLILIELFSSLVAGATAAFI